MLAFMKLHKEINILLLYIYVASVSLISLQVTHQTSISFITGGLFLLSKAYGFLFIERKVMYEAECILFVSLLIYLTGIDYLMHNGEIINSYYTTFALNCIMFIALVDEFKKDSAVGGKAMLIFSTVLVIIALLVTIGIGAEVSSQTGRITFMHQNENDLAFSCMIAYIFFSRILIVSDVRKLFPSLVIYLSTLLLLTVLIKTGTRFVLFAVIIHLLILSMTVLLTRKLSWRPISVILSWIAIIFVITTNFHPMVDRLSLSPEVPNNNLTDIGGRTGFWVDSWNAIQESPIFGLGYDGYGSFVLSHNRFFGLPHNFVLEIGSIGGLVGLTILLVLLIKISAQIYLAWTRCKSLEVLNWALPIASAAMFLNITHMKVVWFLMAFFIIIAIPHRISNAS